MGEVSVIEPARGPHKYLSAAKQQDCWKQFIFTPKKEKIGMRMNKYPCLVSDQELISMAHEMVKNKLAYGYRRITMLTTFFQEI